MAAAPVAPQVIVLGGANGSGKSTVATGVLRDRLQLGEFVNADTIAAGLSAYAPERVAMAAGRIMLRRLDELASARAHFAFETTMASRSFVPFLQRLRNEFGYEVMTVFMYLDSPSLAVSRVADRVRAGGHSIPEEVVHRRYARGIANFVGLCLPVSTSFRVNDNSERRRPKLVAFGSPESPIIEDASSWAHMLEITNDNA